MIQLEEVKTECETLSYIKHRKVIDNLGQYHNALKMPGHVADQPVLQSVGRVRGVRLSEMTNGLLMK